MNDGWMCGGWDGGDGNDGMDGWMPIHAGPWPYAMLFCPYRASITLKGFNNLAQGLAPGNQSAAPGNQSDRPCVYPVRIKTAPVGGK